MPLQTVKPFRGTATDVPEVEYRRAAHRLRMASCAGACLSEVSLAGHSTDRPAYRGGIYAAKDCSTLEWALATDPQFTDSPDAKRSTPQSTLDEQATASAEAVVPEKPSRPSSLAALRH